MRDFSQIERATRRPFEGGPDVSADADVTLEAFKDFVASEYTIIRLDEAATDRAAVARDHQIDPGFLDSAASGFEAYAEKIISRLDMTDEPSYGYTVSPRTRINLHALSRGYRPLQDPFDGKIQECVTSLGREWYWLGQGSRYCLVSELSQPMTFMGVEGLWVFPQQKLILWFWNGYGVADIVDHVAQLFARLYPRRDAVAQHLFFKGTRKAGLVDFNCPHVCHNFWNVMTGWANILEYADPKSFDYVVQYDNQNFYGLVQDLFPSQVEGKGFKVANTEEDLLDFLFETSAFLLTVKDENISDFFTQASLRYAYTQVSQTFLDEVKAFRASVHPFILITVRLDNRAWVDQVAGWTGLINELSKTYPKLGIMFDGLSSDSVKGWTTGWMSLEAELEVANAVKSGLNENVSVIFGIGRRFFESIVMCDLVDAFIAPIGSGMTIYKWITNKPGIAISNRTSLDNEHVWGPLRVWDHFCQTIEPATYLPMEMVTDVEDVRDTRSRANFTLDWHDLHAIALPFLKDRFPVIGD